MENIIGKFIKEQRKITNLTQVELSKKAGVGLRFIRDVEQGKKTIRVDVVNKLLLVFGSVLAPVKFKELNKHD